MRWPTTRASSRSGRASASTSRRRRARPTTCSTRTTSASSTRCSRGDVDIAWNTNTAYVVAEAQLGGEAQVLGMRDVDADFRTVVVMRRAESIDSPAELTGKRLALGSRDSGHAAILPLHYLARGRRSSSTRHRSSGSTPISASTATPATPSFGSSGPWRKARPTPARSVTRRGRLCAPTASRPPGSSRSSGGARRTTTATSPRCPRSTASVRRAGRRPCSRWTTTTRPSAGVMDLEGVKRWLPGDKRGYADLTAAMHEQGYL